MVVSLADKLKNLRRSKKITQTELSKAIGMSSSVITHYESGDRMPSFDVLIKLAYFYGVTTDYLLGINDRKILSIDIAGFNEEQIQSLLNIINEFKKTIK